MSALTITLALDSRHLDTLRRALRRHYDALSWVPARQTGDPDPTPLQSEVKRCEWLVSQAGWIEPLDESREPPTITFDAYVWRIVATALDTAATRYTEAARERPGTQQAASYLRLEHQVNIAADTIRHALGDDDESDE